MKEEEEEHLFKHFSNETTFHGFKRLFVGSKWRWPFWTIIISAGIVMSIYQISSKFRILQSNPLNININMVYQDEILFPSITICNKLTIRASFLVNNTILLNLLHIIYPQGKKPNITKQNEEDMKKVDKMWTAKEFFALAAIPKEEAILWCQLPNGQDCSSNDFVTVVTDEGYCYKLVTNLVIKEAGRGNGMRILFNLGQYDRILDTDSLTGARVIYPMRITCTLVIHDPEQDAFPSKGYDLMPGYQGAVVLRKTKNTQIGNCERGNPLKYYDHYTYPACRVEYNLVKVAQHCGCKPYTLPILRDGIIRNATIDDLPDCTVFQHFTCIESSLGDFSVSNTTSKSYKPTVNPCTGECIRNEFDQEIYLNLFRDKSIFKGMLGSKDDFLHESYRRGLDSSSFLYFYQKNDDDYRSLLLAAKSYENLIVRKRLLPSYTTVPEILLEKLPCLNDLFQNLRKNETETKIPIRHFNATLIETIKIAIMTLESKIDSLEIEGLLRFATSMKNVHLMNCSSERDEICSVAALYDLLSIRDQLREKNIEVQSLSNKYVKNMNSLIELFLRKGGTLYQLFNQSKIEERELLKQMMEQYVDQVTLCFNETSTIYIKLLKSGQPTMKTAEIYDNFLNELFAINETIYSICKEGSSLMDSSYNFTNRQEMALKIINLMSSTESGTTKSILYNRIIVELIENMHKKFYAYEYDYLKLNDSLYDVENMNNLLNKYLNQSVGSLFKKTDFYNDLHDLNTPFQSGVNRYKTTVENYIWQLDEFFQIYVKRLIEYNYDIDNPLMKLLLDSNMDENFFNNFNDSSDVIGQIVCLKKAKMVLKTIGKDYLEPSKLDEYRQSVQSLVDSLSVYVDDIKLLKKFHQDNLGLVKIYFRDMGVKETTQEAAYDILSFFCDIGGIIGLWLGGSIVSLVEVCDLLCFERIRTFCGKCKKDKKSTKKPSKTNNNSKRSIYKMKAIPTKDDQVLEAQPLERTPDGGLNTKLSDS